MTLATDEALLHGSSPREFYAFVVAGAANRYYTNWHESVTFESNLYLSTSISRSGISIAPNSWNSLEVYAPRSLDICTDHVFAPPSRDIELTIKRHHGNAANAGTIWKGKVTAASLKDRDTVKFIVPSLIAAAVTSKVPNVFISSLCNHWLYDTRCGVLSTSFDFATTVSSIDSSDSRIINIPDPGGSLDDYKGGWIQRDSDGEKRLIVSQNPRTQIVVQEAFRILSPADAVTIFQGCDRRILTCNTKFANKQRHGGFPYIPVEHLFKFGTRKSGG